MRSLISTRFGNTSRTTPLLLPTELRPSVNDDIVRTRSCSTVMEISLCSDCFQDPGLRIDAERVGIEVDGACPVCGSATGRKLDKQRIASVAKSFFVWGTMSRSQYG